MSEIQNDESSDGVVKQFSDLIQSLNYDNLQNQNIEDFFSIILNKNPNQIGTDDWFILDTFATALVR